MRRPEAQYTPVVLPESVVQRVRAAVENFREHEQTALEEPTLLHELPLFQEAPGLPGPADLQEPAGAPELPGPPARATRHTTPPSPWFPVNPDDDTQQFPAISASADTDQETPVPDVTSLPPKRDARPCATRSAKHKPSAAAPAPEPASRTPAVPSAEAPAAASGQTVAPRVRTLRRYRMAAVLISVAVLVATGSVAFALSRHGAERSHRNPAPPTQTISNIAAAWVASQVSEDAVVSCDPAMCHALSRRGIPVAHLLTLRSGKTDPLHSGIIVATRVVRSEFGRRLASVYAPAVIASFGSGDLRIDIRAIAPHGASAYRSQMKADLQTRKEAGVGLANSQLITASVAARAELTGGEVDWRLLFVIAELAGMQPVSILAFGDSGPGASPGVPLRSADLAESASQAGTANPAYVRSLVNFLHLQHGTYAPAHIWTVRATGGRPALRIEFAAPTPVDMLTPSDLP